MVEIKKVVLKKRFKYALNAHSCQEMKLDARTIEWLNERFNCFFTPGPTKYLKDESGHNENLVTNYPDNEELRILADEYGAIWTEVQFDYIFRPAMIPNLRIGHNSDFFQRKNK